MAASTRCSSPRSTSWSAPGYCASTCAASATPRRRCRCTPAPTTSRRRSTRRRCSPSAPASRGSGRRRRNKACNARGGLFEVVHAARVGEAHEARRAVRAEIDAWRGGDGFLLQQIEAEALGVAAAIGVHVERAVRFRRDRQSGAAQRRDEEIASPCEFVSSPLQNRNCLGQEGRAGGVLRRSRRGDEQVLRQLLEAAHCTLREHDPAQTPAGHAEVLREAVDQHHLALGLPGGVGLINSFSQYFCMTGWRLGWAGLPVRAMRSFEKLAQHLFISAPAPSQHAACSAFLPETVSILEGRRNEFARRRDFLVPALRGAGLSIPAEPHGAFYVYADCGGDAKRFSLDLLQKEAVAATPGVDFGANGTARFVRFAYTRSMDDLEEAAARITRFVSSPSA